jgi:N-acetylmuramoyl-L-alanine amidase
MEILRGHLNDRGVRTEQQTAVGKKNGALIGSIFSEVPVILVEMAVLTQPKDEAFIGNKKGQLIMAKALFAGTKAALQALQK